MILSVLILECYELFTNLDGLDAGNGGTIPPDVLVTNQRPDIFLVIRQLRKVILFELTVPNCTTGCKCRHES